MSVYFAQVGTYIKIGFSKDPERRVKNLFQSATRYGRPHDCPIDAASRHLIRAIEGNKDTERRIQEALEDFCVGLEWFADEQPVRDFIATARDRRSYRRVTREGGPHSFVHQWIPEEYRTPDDYDEDAVMARLGAALSGWSLT